MPIKKGVVATFWGQGPGKQCGNVILSILPQRNVVTETLDLTESLSSTSYNQHIIVCMDWLIVLTTLNGCRSFSHSDFILVDRYQKIQAVNNFNTQSDLHLLILYPASSWFLLRQTEKPTARRVLILQFKFQFSKTIKSSTFHISAI